MKLKTFKNLLTAAEFVFGSAAYAGAAVIGANFLSQYMPVPKNKFQGILIKLGGGCLGSAIGGVAYKNIKDITDNGKGIIETLEATKVYNEIEQLLTELSKHEENLPSDYIQRTRDERHEIFSDDDISWKKKTDKLNKIKDCLTTYLSFVGDEDEDDATAEE